MAKIVAWNKKTGSEYVFFEKGEYADLHLVSTKEYCSPWIVKGSSIVFKKPKLLKKVPKEKLSRSERMIGNQNARKHKPLQANP